MFKYVVRCTFTCVLYTEQGGTVRPCECMTWEPHLKNSMSAHPVSCKTTALEAHFLSASMDDDEEFVRSLAGSLFAPKMPLIITMSRTLHCSKLLFDT